MAERGGRGRTRGLWLWLDGKAELSGGILEERMNVDWTRYKRLSQAPTRARAVKWRYWSGPEHTVGSDRSRRTDARGHRGNWHEWTRRRRELKKRETRMGRRSDATLLRDPIEGGPQEVSALMGGGLKARQARQANETCSLSW